MKGCDELFRRLSAMVTACLICGVVFGTPCFAAGDFPSAGEGAEWLAWHAGTAVVIDQDALREGYHAYLASPSLAASQSQARIKLLHQCASQLGPGVAIKGDFEKAIALLRQLDSDPLDNGRCRSLLSTVTNAASSLSGSKKPDATQAALLRKREILSYNLRLELKEQQQRLEASGLPSSKRSRLHPSPPSKAAQQLSALDEEIAKINLGGDVSKLQARLELQELAHRFLRQGDYDEAILAVRFYRGLFGEWDSPLRLSRDAMEEMVPSDVTPTVGTIESLSSQALQEINENLSRSTILLEGNYPIAASDELLKAVTRGSRTTEVLSFPQKSKQKIQRVLQLLRGLEKSLADKDYDEASGFLPAIGEVASDFDTPRYDAEIQAAESLSTAHLVSARSAAREGRIGDVMKELRIAEESWPKNPGIAPLVKEFAGSMRLKNSSVEEFDALYAARRMDEIAKQRPRFEAILSDQPVRHAQLREVLEDYDTIHDGTERVMQLRDLGLRVCSWELADFLHTKYPGRGELTALSESMLPGVEELASGLKQAAILEKKQPSSALAHYLMLQQRFPLSWQAKAGINRIAFLLLSR